MSAIQAALTILTTGLAVAFLYWLINRKKRSAHSASKGSLVIASCAFLASILVFWVSVGIGGTPITMSGATMTPMLTSPIIVLALTPTSTPTSLQTASPVPSPDAASTAVPTCCGLSTGGTGGQPPLQSGNDSPPFEHSHNFVVPAPNAEVEVEYPYLVKANEVEVVEAAIYTLSELPAGNIVWSDTILLDPNLNVVASTDGIVMPERAYYTALIYANGVMALSAESNEFDLSLNSPAQQRFYSNVPDWPLTWAWFVRLKDGIGSDNGFVTVKAHLPEVPESPVWQRSFEIEIAQPTLPPTPTPVEKSNGTGAFGGISAPAIGDTGVSAIAPATNITVSVVTPQSTTMQRMSSNLVDNTAVLVSACLSSLIGLLAVVVSFLSYWQDRRRQPVLEPSTLNSAEQVSLFRKLDHNYDEQELRTLALELGIDYEDLPFPGQANKARELVALMARSDRLEELKTIIKSDRPHLFPKANAVNEPESHSS